MTTQTPPISAPPPIPPTPKQRHTYPSHQIRSHQVELQPLVPGTLHTVLLQRPPHAVLQGKGTQRVVLLQGGRGITADVPVPHAQGAGQEVEHLPHRVDALFGHAVAVVLEDFIEHLQRLGQKLYARGGGLAGPSSLPSHHHFGHHHLHDLGALGRDLHPVPLDHVLQRLGPELLLQSSQRLLLLRLLLRGRGGLEPVPLDAVHPQHDLLAQVEDHARLPVLPEHRHVPYHGAVEEGGVLAVRLVRDLALDHGEELIPLEAERDELVPEARREGGHEEEAPIDQTRGLDLEDLDGGTAPEEGVDRSRLELGFGQELRLSGQTSWIRPRFGVKEVVEVEGDGRGGKEGVLPDGMDDVEGLEEMANEPSRAGGNSLGSVLLFQTIDAQQARLKVCWSYEKSV